MKKRRLKKWVKKLLITLVIYSIGIGCIFILCERVKQIDRSMNYEEVNKFNN